MWSAPSDRVASRSSRNPMFTSASAVRRIRMGTSTRWPFYPRARPSLGEASHRTGNRQARSHLPRRRAGRPPRPRDPLLRVPGIRLLTGRLRRVPPPALLRGARARRSEGTLRVGRCLRRPWRRRALRSQESRRRRRYARRLGHPLRLAPACSPSRGRRRLRPPSRARRSRAAAPCATLWPVTLVKRAQPARAWRRSLRSPRASA
jgi:hypothetical protein